jgi:hypothetical protein
VSLCSRVKVAMAGGSWALIVNGSRGKRAESYGKSSPVSGETMLNLGVLWGSSWFM